MTVANDDFDYDKIDPGVRATVRWLRSKGFATCDSGDGVSKVGTALESEMLPFPHVAMVSTVSGLVCDADRLVTCLEEHGVPFFSGDPETDVGIEASYSPLDGHALIMIININDVLMDLTGSS